MFESSFELKHVVEHVFSSGWLYLALMGICFAMFVYGEFSDEKSTNAPADLALKNARDSDKLESVSDSADTGHGVSPDELADIRLELSGPPPRESKLPSGAEAPLSKPAQVFDATNPTVLRELIRQAEQQDTQRDQFADLPENSRTTAALPDASVSAFAQDFPSQSPVSSMAGFTEASVQEYENRMAQMAESPSFYGDSSYCK